jgi:transformer-2 protein
MILTAGKILSPSTLWSVETTDFNVLLRKRSRSRSRRSRSRSRRSRSPEERRRRSPSDSRGRKRSRSQSPSKYRKQRHFGDRADPNESRCLGMIIYNLLGHNFLQGVFNLGRRTSDEEFRRIFERYGKLEVKYS